jgi:hypothetical protein
MMQQYREFQSQVFGVHIRMPWAQRIYEALHFIESHPDAIPLIGLIPCGGSTFLVNSKLCAPFFGIKRNSCNRNFQQHGFRVENQGNIRDILALKCPSFAGNERHWVMRVFSFGEFNADSTPEEVALASAHARSVRSHRPFAVPQTDRVPAEPDLQPPAAPAAISDPEEAIAGWGGGSEIESDMVFSMGYSDRWEPWESWLAD